MIQETGKQIGREINAPKRELEQFLADTETSEGKVDLLLGLMATEAFGDLIDPDKFKYAPESVNSANTLNPLHDLHDIFNAGLEIKCQGPDGDLYSEAYKQLTQYKPNQHTIPLRYLYDAGHYYHSMHGKYSVDFYYQDLKASERLLKDVSFAARAPAELEIPEPARKLQEFLMDPVTRGPRMYVTRTVAKGTVLDILLNASDPYRPKEDGIPPPYETFYEAHSLLRDIVSGRVGNETEGNTVSQVSEAADAAKSIISAYHKPLIMKRNNMGELPSFREVYSEARGRLLTDIKEVAIRSRKNLIIMLQIPGV